MFDDETFGYFGLPTTLTDEEETTQKVSEESTSSSSYESPVDNSVYDDYTVRQNYTEEQSYNSNSMQTIDENVEDGQETFTYNISLPTIEKEKEPEQEVVSLIKTRQKITLSPRMKIVISAFSIIMFALVFLIIFNYASLGGLRATIADKEAIVAELQLSISELKETYNMLDNDEALKDRAENAGFVEKNDTNTARVSLGEFYTEETVEKLPSNWFNDVCEFFSRIFG